MAEIYAPIVDGQAMDATSVSKRGQKETEKTHNDSLDKDAFLQLLVAEMQYQDPLEPTTNTDYISQFATFSQLEATQNVEYSNKVAMANNLVGKQVIMKVNDPATGSTVYKDGQVDYVYLEAGKVYLSIGEEKYNVDNLDTVVDSTYLDAVSFAKAFVSLVDKLPSARTVTLSDGANIDKAVETFNKLDAYYQNFIPKETVDKLTEVAEALGNLRKEQNSGGEQSNTQSGEQKAEEQESK